MFRRTGREWKVHVMCGERDENVVGSGMLSSFVVIGAKCRQDGYREGGNISLGGERHHPPPYVFMCVTRDGYVQIWYLHVGLLLRMT